jgi:hypothetical protein
MPKIRYRRLVRTRADNNMPRIYTDKRGSELIRGHSRKSVAQNKNVAQGRFEYSHSPDNRALTKPYPVTTYLVAN